MNETNWREIRASLAGDEAAYASLMERHQKAIGQLMWRFTRQRGEWEQLVQDVFVEAYFSLASFRGKAPFLHWLRRIATRVGYKFWTQRERRKRFVPLENVDAASIEPDGRTPEEASALLDALLHQLPPPERLVLTMQYLEECSLDEVAERMGWTVGRVKMRAHRAKKKLHEIAKREGLVDEP